MEMVNMKVFIDEVFKGLYEAGNEIINEDERFTNGTFDPEDLAFVLNRSYMILNNIITNNEHTPVEECEQMKFMGKITLTHLFTYARHGFVFNEEYSQIREDLMVSLYQRLVELYDKYENVIIR